MKYAPACAWVALVVLLFGLSLLRRPDALPNPQFWAEDGQIFFPGALLNSGWRLLFQPYAFYLHLLPRLVAALSVRLFRPSALPFVFNLTALILAALISSLFALRRFRYLLASDLLRVAVCLIIAVALPADELLACLTSLNVYLFLATLLILAQPPSIYTPRSAWAWAVVALLNGLSMASVILLVPFALKAAISRRSLASLPHAAVILAAGAQLITLVTTSPPSQLPSPAQLAVALPVAVTYR